MFNHIFDELFNIQPYFLSACLRCLYFLLFRVFNHIKLFWRRICLERHLICQPLLISISCWYTRMTSLSLNLLHILIRWDFILNLRCSIILCNCLLQLLISRERKLTCTRFLVMMILFGLFSCIIWLISLSNKLLLLIIWNVSKFLILFHHNCNIITWRYSRRIYIVLMIERILMFHVTIIGNVMNCIAEILLLIKLVPICILMS